jgi:hypothetical protein
VGVIRIVLVIVVVVAARDRGQPRAAFPRRQ